MNHIVLVRNLETLRQDNHGERLYSRERAPERAQRLNFLKLSARYLGQTLTVRQLHILAGHRGQ